MICLKSKLYRTGNGWNVRSVGDDSLVTKPTKPTNPHIHTRLTRLVICIKTININGRPTELSRYETN